MSTFDYFYGGEVEQYSFYRIPRTLIIGERFKGVSTDAKLLYGLMLDRMGLSFKNGWLDDNGRVFIYYSLDDIQTSLGCAHQKACKLLAELDTSKGIGLIERKKQGQGKPARIYVKRFYTQEDRPTPPSEPLGPGTGAPDFSKSEPQSAENQKSRLPLFRSADFSTSSPNYTYPSQPYSSQPYPSIYPPCPPLGRLDGWDRREEIKEQIGYVCPDSLLFKRSYFEVGDKVGRVLFLREYASYVKDTMLTELSDFSRDLMLSIDILPVPMGEAVKDVQNRILGVETEITRTEQRQIANNSFSAGIPYELEQFRREAKEFLDDLTTRDQRMMLCDVTLVHTAGTLEELDADTASIVSIAQKHSCELGVLNYEQEDGLNTVLPYGLRRIHARRTLTTESVAVLMPFKVQEIQDTGGLYYGVNAVSKNLLICDRKKLQNGHGFWLGVSGSGKSFSVKEELTLAALSTDDDILVVDSEREFGPLVWALGGEVVTLEPGSPHHINALAMHKGHGKEENPVILKSEFMMSVFEQLMGADKLGPKHKSILDRCTANVFRAYIKKYEGPEPTLPDFRAELLRQPEPEAQEMALALELFSDGSLDLFAHETNVDMSRRIIGFDMFGLGDHLRPLGMLVMLNALENRVVENKARGRFTRIYIDEGYLYFLYQYSAQVLYKFWKRLRKLGGMMTLITQNVEECLRSDTARLMFANSEFLVMLNQAPTDRVEPARLLHISDTQLSYITNADVGCGLVKVGGSIVPFQNEFPRDTELYRLMSTTPNEKF